MKYLDYAAVDVKLHGVVASHGFVITDRRTGTEVIDDEAIKDALFDEIVNNHLVNDADDLYPLAFTDSEIYAVIFPNGPGVHSAPQTPEDEEVRARLTRKIWNWAGTGVSSQMQMRLEAEGYSAVLCQADVGRKIRFEETGKSKAVMVPGRFITDNEELILAYYTSPLAKKLTKTADSVRKQAELANRRHPELTGRVARQIGTGLAEASATLKPVTDAKAALGAGPKADDAA